MKTSFCKVLLLACTMILAVQAADKSASKQAEIVRALSAAPASIRGSAAVVAMDDNGHTTELRAGTNGWTCLPHDPATPLGHPVCVDQNGWAWFQAAMTGHEPDGDKVGYSYMLKGGSVWSNVDITATKLPPGRKQYIVLPPHVMIMNAKIASASGFPGGEDPDPHKPFVMYAGTPYAIVIMPLN